MNDSQQAYANMDSDLGHLLVQIDTFYADLPEPVRRAFDRLGSGAKYGCHCDLEEGMQPDECVIDSNTRSECVHAQRIESKIQCQFWRPLIRHPK